MAKQKILILGAGESGVGTALLAKKKGYEVLVSDFGKIKDKYKEVLINNVIAWEEGGHSEEKIFQKNNFPLVVKSPGIPETAPIVVKLKAQGSKVISDVEFAFRYT